VTSAWESFPLHPITLLHLFLTSSLPFPHCVPTQSLLYLVIVTLKGCNCYNTHLTQPVWRSPLCAHHLRPPTTLLRPPTACQGHPLPLNLWSPPCFLATSSRLTIWTYTNCMLHTVPFYPLDTARPSHIVTPTKYSQPPTAPMVQ
jgi:hypothetical protein